MYVLSSGACNMPNSATPMSQPEIDAQDAYIAAVGSIFDRGDDTMDTLVQILGGNPVSASAGDAGVATVGSQSAFDPNPMLVPVVSDTPGVPSASGAPPAPGSPVANARFRRYVKRNEWRFGGGPGGGGFPLGVPEALAAARRSIANDCTNPEEFPLRTVFPMPIVMTPAPARPASPAPAILPASPAPPAPAPKPVAIPSTGNVCADLALGLITQDQVTLDQMRYCSNNGYAGGHQSVPPCWVIQAQAALSASGKLPKIPFQSSPPNTNAYQAGPPDTIAFFNSLPQGCTPPGMSGLGDLSSLLQSPGVWAGVAVAGLALWYFSRKR